MKRTNNKIIYLDKTHSIHFFYSPQDGICLLDNDTTQSLLKDAYEDFDVCYIKGEIFIVCQNKDGDIILLKHFNDAWHKYTLLVSKVKGAYSKNFQLVITGDCIQLFYTIKASDRLLLIQQILGCENSEPVVVASVSNCKKPFFAITDAQLNTYVYYQCEHIGFGYRIYKWSSKAFGEFSLIENEVFSSIYALTDTYGRQHICCQGQDSIIYTRRNIDGEYTKIVHIPFVYANANNTSYIKLEEEKIYIIWQQQHILMYCVSIDDGETFSAPTKIIPSGDMPFLFSVQSENVRTYSFGRFVGDEIRNINIGTHVSIEAQRKISNINKRPIYQENTQNNTDMDIKRIKNAIASISKEVNELKNRLDLVIGIIENKKND